MVEDVMTVLMIASERNSADGLRAARAGASGDAEIMCVAPAHADETIGRAEPVLGEPVEGLDDAGFDAGGATGESDPVSPCTTLLSPSGGTHPGLHSPYRNGVTTRASNADALEQRFGLQVQRAE
jgi:hypothetical protein